MHHPLRPPPEAVRRDLCTQTLTPFPSSCSLLCIRVPPGTCALILPTSTDCRSGLPDTICLPAHTRAPPAGGNMSLPLVSVVAAPCIVSRSGALRLSHSSHAHLLQITGVSHVPFPLVDLQAYCTPAERRALLSVSTVHLVSLSSEKQTPHSCGHRSHCRLPALHGLPFLSACSGSQRPSPSENAELQCACFFADTEHTRPTHSTCLPLQQSKRSDFYHAA